MGETSFTSVRGVPLNSTLKLSPHRLQKTAPGSESAPQFAQVGDVMLVLVAWSGRVARQPA